MVGRQWASATLFVLIAVGCASSAPSGAPSPSAAPTVSISAPPPSELGQATPPLATAYTQWERIDLPDPAPGLAYAGAMPGDIVAFNGVYLAFGTIIASCCDGGDPSQNSGVVWRSPDGHSWEVKADIAAFEHASLGQVLVARSRLLAYGSYTEPGGSTAEPPARGPPTMWTSPNGLAWTRIGGVVPDLVAQAGPGFAGFYRAEGGAAALHAPTFMKSADGMTWTDASAPIAGWIADLIATPDGGAMAVGWVDGPPAADGGPTFNAVAWHSVDGVTWTGPTTIATGGSALSVVPGGRGYLAVGWDGRQAAALWSSSDGLTWRQETVETPEGGSLSQLFVVPGGFLIVGDATVWFSSDGRAWGRAPDQNGRAGNDLDLATLISTLDGVVAVGRGWDAATYHPTPEAWLASP